MKKVDNDETVTNIKVKVSCMLFSILQNGQRLINSIS